MTALPQGCSWGVDEIRLFQSSWEDSGFSEGWELCVPAPAPGRAEGGGRCGEHRMRDMYSSLQGQGPLPVRSCPASWDLLHRGALGSQ